MDTKLQKYLDTQITEITEARFHSLPATAVGGGCINRSYRLKSNSINYFVKLNSIDKAEMFTAEYEALGELQATCTIRVPKPLLVGHFDAQSFLILEDLEFASSKSNWSLMGKQLAQLHRHSNEQHGWHRDNTIGLTQQKNQLTKNWADFFCSQRLAPQLEHSQQQGYSIANTEVVLENTQRILGNHTPEPSLLHGDLWSGNAGFLTDGTPVIYDPATYYGDRETDIAFTEFFGGFPSSFYQAYQNEWPLEATYDQRKDLYNLYHVLNHLNLFGRSYLTQAQTMIRQLIS